MERLVERKTEGGSQMRKDQGRKKTGTKHDV